MCPPACRGQASPWGPQPSARRRVRAVEIQNGVGLARSLSGPSTSQAAQKGPDARRRPTAAGEAYSLYVEPAAEGANEADGPFSAACGYLGESSTMPRA